MSDPSEIARFHDRASDLMRALLAELASAPELPRPFPAIEDALGWPRRRIASVLGGAGRMRQLEFGGRRPYRFHDERTAAAISTAVPVHSAAWTPAMNASCPAATWPPATRWTSASGPCHDRDTAPTPTDPRIASPAAAASWRDELRIPEPMPDCAAGTALSVAAGTAGAISP